MRNATRPRTFALLPVLVAAVVSTVLVGAGVVVVDAVERAPECAVDGSSLKEAKQRYADRCSLPRIDCDKVDGVWYCSSRVIGKSAPGGVTADDVGASGIGNDGTIVVTVPPTPPTTAGDPTTTTSSDTTTSTTEASTTTAAPTTQAPTTQPPTTPTTSIDDDDDDGGQMVERTFGKNEGPDRNPMKGWNSGWNDDRPESSVGFQYIKWSDLEPQNGQFDFEAVEDIIDRPGSRNRHLVLRLYCDWHGANQTSRGCPDWIYSEVGVQRLKGDNGRYITDYNDPRYLDEAVQAIKALGARYDDDPRLYAIQIGVLGYWGEWHTWGSSFGGDSYQIDVESERTVIDAYKASFDRVQLMARYPYRSIPASAPDLGFHNDYFRPNNGHSAEFDAAVSSGRKWLEGPIGGEVPPGLSSDDYHHLYATSQGAEMIAIGHYSTMKPGSVSSAHSAAHMQLHKKFGYNYQIDRVRYTDLVSPQNKVAVQLNVRNIGVAPFYYDWNVQFALLDDGDRPVTLVAAPGIDLRDFDSGQSFALTGAIPADTAGAGDFRLAVRLIQPDADKAKPVGWKLDVRNTYIQFANDIPTIDGTWSAQNQLAGGWSILGQVTVK